MQVRITDEFHSVWFFETESPEEIAGIVLEWLKSRDNTPIYEILITV
jgi:hypothetical protein